MNKLSFLLVAGAAAQQVLVLTNDNYKETLEKNAEGILVEFYAPWCGHCKKLEPEWDKAAEQLHSDGIKIPLSKVDATVESTLSNEVGVSGYPTIKWCVASKCADYDGPRQADGIVQWVKTMTGPAVTESEPTGTDAVTVLLKGSELPSWYEEGAKVHRKKATFYYVKDDASSMTLTHTGEDAIKPDAVPSDADSFEKFMKDNTFPLFGALDGDTFQTYMERGNGMIWTLLPMTEENMKEVVEEKREMMTNVAKKLGSEYSVTWTNTDSFKKVLESMFGITEFPRMVVQKTVGGKKNFIYDGEITEEKVLAYIQDVKDDKITSHLKSEEIPAANDDPVKVIVGKSIETEVFHAEKDVLFEIYAPWCGHCKKLDPELVKVGKKVVKEGLSDILVIAKMDGTQNDSPVESMSWTGFPTIYYVKAGSDKPEKFDGPRDAKGIWKWIKKNHSQADKIKEKLAAKKADKPKDEL